MKIRMAEQITVFLCEHCDAVHIAMWRNGKIFAQAIPMDAAAVAGDLNAAIAESLARQAGLPTGRKH